MKAMGFIATPTYVSIILSTVNQKRNVGSHEDLTLFDKTSQM